MYKRVKKYIKHILIILFISGSEFSFSQELNGKITDNQGIGIPHVSVRIENTTHGTVANANGNYQISLSKGRQILKFYSSGFQTLIDTIDILSASTTLNVTLIETSKEIDEVVVLPTSAKERGKEIMKQVIDKRSYFQELLSEYSCDTYCFSSLEKEKRDSLIKELVIGKEKMNIIEWKAKTSYKANDKFKDEFYAVHDNSDYEPAYQPDGVNITIEGGGAFGDAQQLAPSPSIQSNPYLFINGIKDAHFSIFDNTILSPKIAQNPIISPLAFNANLFYTFYLERTFVDSSSHLIHEIKIKPRFSHEALFEGTLFVADQSWEVVSYDLGINPSVLLFFKDIRIICDYEKKDDHLVPVRREFVYTIKEDQSVINGMIRVAHSDYSFDLGEKKAKYWLESAVFSPDAFDKDSSYWNSERPFSLKSFERNFMREQDSILNYQETDEYKRKNDSIRNQIGFLAVTVRGFQRVNSFKKQEFIFLPLAGQIIPFGVGGFRYRFEMSYKKEFENHKIIDVKPMINYGFLNGDLKGSLESSLMYNPLNFSTIGFKIGDTYDYVSGTQNLVSLLIPKNRVRNQKLEVGFYREVSNGLYMNTSLLYSDRTSIDNIKYPGWLAKTDSLNPQKPYSFERYKIVFATIDLEYHIQSKYMIRKGKKIVYGSPWPTFYLTYKKGIPKIFQSNSDFDYLQFKIQDDINLKSFGTSQFLLDAGTYLQKKNLRAIEYKYFRPSDLTFFSNPIYSLQLLDTSLNTENSYLQFNFIHHFNGFFLNKIWLINKLKLEETVGGGLLMIPDAHFKQAEFYVGLERKFRTRRELFKIGIYFATSDSNLGKANFHFKLGINSFNNFTNKWQY